MSLAGVGAAIALSRGFGTRRQRLCDAGHQPVALRSSRPNLPSAGEGLVLTSSAFTLPMGAAPAAPIFLNE